MDKKNEEFICYSLRLMYKLTERGFKYDYKRPNLKKPEFDCWVYIRTPELDKTLSAIFEGGA